MQKKRGVLTYFDLTVVRRIVQVFFLLFILYGGLLGITKLDKTQKLSLDEQAVANTNENLQKDPRWDIYLPIRSCKNTDKETGVFKGCGMYMLSKLFTYRNLLSYAIPLFILIGLMLLFGRTWCGWVCPMGLIQETLDWLRGKLKINYIRLPRVVNRILRKIRYGWLATIFLVSFAVALPLFATIRKDLYNINCLTCPTRYALYLFPGFDPTFMSFNTTYYFISSIILILFIGIVICSFFVRRFWCRLCPNGALLSLFNKGCFTTKEKDVQKCTKCGICYQVCPMDNEDVYTVVDRKTVNSKNCIMCFECVKSCPEDDCLQVKIANKTVLSSKFNKN